MSVRVSCVCLSHLPARMFLCLSVWNTLRACNHRPHDALCSAPDAQQVLANTAVICNSLASSLLFPSPLLSFLFVPCHSPQHDSLSLSSCLPSLTPYLCPSLSPPIRRAVGPFELHRAREVPRHGEVRSAVRDHYYTGAGRPCGAVQYGVVWAGVIQFGVVWWGVM